MKIIKDICTLADGESTCLAGVATLIAVLIGMLIMVYVFFSIQPDNVKDVCEILRNFGFYHSGVLGTGCAGKFATNRAEEPVP